MAPSSVEHNVTFVTKNKKFFREKEAESSYCITENYK